MTQQVTIVGGGKGPYFKEKPPTDSQNNSQINIINILLTLENVFCHHGMARPQVADRGMASDKQGSCK